MIVGRRDYPRNLRRDTTAGFTIIELLVVIAIIGVLVALMLPAVQQARESARRVQCANNLKQIGVALQCYHDANTYLPYGSDWTQTPANSPNWSTMILPFLERQAHYDMFNFTTTMDDPSNTAAVTTTVTVYICPSDPVGRTPVCDNRCTCCTTSSPLQSHGLWYPGSMGPVLATSNCNFCPDPNPSSTNYCCQGNSWGAPNTGSTDGTAPGMFHRFKAMVRFSDVTDGLTNTILCGEALPDQNMHNSAFAVNMPMGATNIPMNLMATPDQMPAPMPDALLHIVNPIDQMMGYKSRHLQGAQFLLSDGSVRFFLQTIDFQLYNQLGTRAGGETVALP